MDSTLPILTVDRGACKVKMPGEPLSPRVVKHPVSNYAK